MKFLIVGLGNPGSEYARTRHNIGFEVVNALATLHGATWSSVSHGHLATIKVKGKTIILLKPNTYMNLSGKAVRYWLQHEKLELEQLLVVTDDKNLNFGSIRLRGKGSAGGHNGLTNIQELLQSSNYARLRVGIGSDFAKGRQVDYVLGEWDKDEQKKLPDIIKTGCDCVVSFCIAGLANAMNSFNNLKI